MLATATSNFINATLYEKLPYNFLRDIQPVASISCTPLVMVAFPVDPVLLVLFLVYVTIHELSLLFGDGELYRLFFRLRSSEAKLTRRRRIRLLVCLNRLTEANSRTAGACDVEGRRRGAANLAGGPAAAVPGRDRARRQAR